MRCHSYIAFVLLVFAAFPQTVTQSGPRRHQTVWEPPASNFPQNPKASVPKEMLAKLRVSAYDITLEETSMEDAAKRFGGTIGSKGEAGDFLEWLCLHGTDAADDWVLWLESGEIDGGYVGSFQWQLATRCCNLRDRHNDQEGRIERSLPFGRPRSAVVVCAATVSYRSSCSSRPED